MKRLLLRGDDAGGCRSANEAIAEACAAGALRNVSVMACGPALDEAVPLLQAFPAVCLGLHVTLNAEWAGPKWGPVLPPAQVPSLLDGDTGWFPPNPKDLNRPGFSVEEAIAEVAAQLGCLRDAGLSPVYLDEHMGVGWLPGLHDGLADLCRREGLIYANALTFSPLPRVEMPTGAPLIEQWVAQLTAADDNGNYRIVTHPGKDAPDMRAFYLAGGEPGVIARERDAERRALTDPSLREQLDALGVMLVRYDQL